VFRFSKQMCSHSIYSCRYTHVLHLVEFHWTSPTLCLCYSLLLLLPLLLLSLLQCLCSFLFPFHNNFQRGMYFTSFVLPCIYNFTSFVLPCIYNFTSFVLPCIYNFKYIIAKYFNSLNGRIILKCISRIWAGRVSTGFVCLRTGTSGQ
jgi:hypothetical protein